MCNVKENNYIMIAVLFLGTWWKAGKNNYQEMTTNSLTADSVVRLRYDERARLKTEKSNYEK